MQEKNYGNIDFHIHSNLSKNGKLNVQEIYDYALQNNMSAIAITDYYAFDNSIKLKQLAHNYGDKIKTFVGVEIPVFCYIKGVRCTAHLIALNVNENSENFVHLKKLLKTNCLNKKANQTYNWFEYINEKSEGKIIFNSEEREKIISEFGYITDQNSAINLLLKYRQIGRKDAQKITDGIDKIEGASINAVDAITFIKATGGTVVLAHPLQSLEDKYKTCFEGSFEKDIFNMAIEEQDEKEISNLNGCFAKNLGAILQELITGDLKGIDAIESAYPAKLTYKADGQKQRSLHQFANLCFKVVDKVAENNKLYLSAGSDFHSYSFSQKGIGYVSNNQGIKYANILEKLDPTLNYALKAQYNIDECSVLFKKEEPLYVEKFKLEKTAFATENI
ncbi:MAG: PHP domain-containing protein [Clostridia bacterium]|jgi:hypothetical protein|nr:PHP domain-containing protein [Clostridia bacterium]